MKVQRQEFIKKKVAEGAVGSQSELVELLRRAGFEASQTTVSRDMGELGLSKLRDGSGGARYVDAEEVRVSGSADSALRRMAPEFMLTAEATGNLVVLKTTPGGAQGLGAALDSAAIPGVAGTVAGDDTVLVVCSARVDSGRIRKILMGYAGIQG